MTIADVTTANSPKRLWPHLVYAFILSLALPTLGAAYLGLSGKDKNHWATLSGLLSLPFFVALMFMVDGQLSLLYVLILIAMWITAVFARAVIDTRLALRNRSSISIAKQGWLPGYWMLLALLILGMKLYFGPSLIFFKPTDAVHAENGLIYGLSYELGKDGIQRGQLLLAHIDGDTRLVRVIALPGDILAQANGVLQVNALQIGRITWHELTDPSSVKSALSDVIDVLTAPSIATPDLLTVTGNTVSFASESATVQVAQKGTFIVAYDNDLIAPPQSLVPTQTLHEENIVMVPWGRFWSLNDHPGPDSDLAQPRIVWAR